MNTDKNVTAVFARIQHTLNIEIVPEGVAEVTPASGSIHDQGTTVTLEVKPDTGWVLDHWEGDLSGSHNWEALTMNEDKNVTAVFTNDLGTIVGTWGTSTLEGTGVGAKWEWFADGTGKSYWDVDGRDPIDTFETIMMEKLDIAGGVEYNRSIDGASGSGNAWLVEAAPA